MTTADDSSIKDALMKRPKMLYLSLALILLFGVVCRFINIDAQGIKIDETWVVPTPNFHFHDKSIYPKLFEYPQYRTLSPALQTVLKTVYDAHPVFQIMLIRAISDTHPPLFFILNYYYSKYFGYELSTVRTPAALYWILAAGVLPFILIAQRFADKTVIFSLFFIALSPFYLFLSNYARPYTLLILLNLLSSFSVYWLARNGLTRKAAVPYVLLCIASLYTHYYAIFVVASQAIFLVYENWRQGIVRENLRKLLWIYLAIGIAFAPWVLVILFQMKSRYPGIESAGSLRFLRVRAFIELISFFSPAYSRSTVSSPLNLAVSFLQLLLVVCGVRHLWQSKDDMASRFWLFMLILPFVLGAIPNNIKPVFSARNFSIVMVPYYVVCAFGISFLKKKVTQIVPAVLIGAIGCYFVVHGLAHENVHGKRVLEDWPGVARYIQTHYASEKPVVYVYDPSFRDALYYYIPSESIVKALNYDAARTGPNDNRFLLVLMNHELKEDEETVKRQVPFMQTERYLSQRCAFIGGAYIYEVQLRHPAFFKTDNPFPPLG
jgi:uncharacterized membrane protein